MTARLTTRRHDRDSAGLTYVYPVISRRAGGVSVGINLNPNNACNWRCIYCQVPDLKRGNAPPVDLPLLERELRGFLADILHGSFMTEHVPQEARQLKDIALSGNGEPTSAAEFDRIVDLIGRVMDDFGLKGKIKLVLITNGSLVHRPAVKRGLARMAELGGEVWFKLDRGSEAGMRLVNGTRTSLPRVRENLATAAALCPTRLQTCLFAIDGLPPDEKELAAYLEFVAATLAAGVTLRGIMLYGLARPPMQAGKERLTALGKDWLDDFARRVAGLGVEVQVSA
ncbi:MAG: radical SAM protein [Sulfuricellaceae bacterium]|jgi:wyosine [tRNA(Phe)-imidazoG37] synthetase (radical SAM superfamily)